MSLRYKIGVLKFHIQHYVTMHIAKWAVRFAKIQPLPNTIISKRVQVISPHPDDEVFGCGGLILRCIKAGNQPHVVILTDGANSLGEWRKDKERIVAERVKLTDCATQALGLKAENLHRFFLKDGILTEEIANISKQELLMKKLKSMEPDYIFVPSPLGDSPDHLAANKFGTMLHDAMVSDGKCPELWNYCVWAWYCHPLQLVKRLSNLHLFKLSKEEHETKLRAVNVYVLPEATTGQYWSGKLPSLFVAIHRWNRELYYKA